MIRIGICLLALTAVIFIGPALAGHEGVYVTTKNIKREKDLLPLDMMIQPVASGVFVRINWDVLQPQANKWDWTLLDKVVIPAVKAGKKLSVGIVAGTYVPKWVGDEEGASYSIFTIQQRGCWKARIYWPWDAAYQETYLRLMRALKEHLQEIGAYNNLQMVKVSFIAQHTLELRLPRRRARTYGGCQLEDASSVWLKAGYRPFLVQRAYERVTDIMANQIFVGKTISQPVQKGDSFPDINDLGQRVEDGVADSPLVADIIETCIAVAGNRCAIQHQSLQMFGPMGDRVLGAAEAGASIGWQTAMYDGRARCQKSEGGSRMHCTRDQFEELLDRAIGAGASYLELWPEDVRDFPDAVKAADERMLSAGL